MKTYRVILEPRGIIHSLPTSDTIFGAICWGIRQLYGEGELKLLLEKFSVDKRKFVVSSAFPVLITPKGNVYLYSKPILPDPKVEEMEKMAEDYEGKILEDFKGNSNIENRTQLSKKVLVGKYKKFKKVEYVSETLFKRLISGNSMAELFKQYLNNKIKVKDEMLLVTSDEYFKEKIFSSRVKIRNKIDRLALSTALAGELYYEKEIYLNSTLAKLYFLIMTEDIDFFSPVFRWLSDTGIGGNRTVGKGHYDIKKSEGEISLLSIEDSNVFITLSRYLPEDGEINWEEENYYELLPYQSRFDTMFFKGGEFLKKRIIYLKEGSVLSFREKKEYYGRFLEVAKFQDNNIYQNGLSFPIFGKI